MSDLRLDQAERQQGVDANEDNRPDQRQAFKEIHDMIRESKHRNDQESEDKRQQSLQSLCTNQDQNGVRCSRSFRATSRSRRLRSLVTVTIGLIQTPIARATGNFRSQPGFWTNRKVERSPKS